LETVKVSRSKFYKVFAYWDNCIYDLPGRPTIWAA
jgi:hypothetical protein